MRHVFLLLTLALLALPAPDSLGRWGAVTCAPVVAQVPQAKLADGWHASAKHPGWHFWIFNGECTGWHEPATGKYQAVLDSKAGKLGPVIDPPWQRQAVGDMEDWMTHGVDRSKLSDARVERVTINGREVTRDVALDAIGKPEIPDDGAKLRATIIGTEAECGAVWKDVLTHPALAEAREKYVWQSYPPGHWALRPGFIQSGHPTIYFQAAPDKPGGSAKVLLRLDSYPGALALAEAVRKADPNYDPAKDPNGQAKPKPEPKPDAPLAPAPKPAPGAPGDDATFYLLFLAVLGMAGAAAWRIAEPQQEQTP